MIGGERIFRPWIPEGFEWALWADPNDSDDLLRTLDERFAGTPWTPFAMKLLRVDDHGRRHRHALVWPPLFHTDRLGYIQAFKLAEQPRGTLYLSEPLVEATRATGSTSGTDFKVVY